MRARSRRWRIPAVKGKSHSDRSGRALWKKRFWRNTAIPSPETLRDSALYHASLLEKYDFTDIVLSMKSSHVPTMVRAYQLASQACDYPLHLGVTEVGTERMGLGNPRPVSAPLLLEGVENTIWVS